MTYQQYTLAVLMWRNRADTIEIAAALKLPEAAVYNALARRNGRRSERPGWRALCAQ